MTRGYHETSATEGATAMDIRPRASVALRFELLRALPLLASIVVLSCGGSHLTIGPGRDSGDAPGSDERDSTTMSGLPVATFGDDGQCGQYTCPAGQQCCLATGVCVRPTDSLGCPAPSVTQYTCGGLLCPLGRICCVLSGQCIDPSNAATDCASPTSSDGQAGQACGSNADCRPTQFCSAPWGHCLGVGTCTSRSNCGYSYGAASSFCGCDGVNYPDIQSACRAGASVSDRRGSCGDPGGTSSLILCGRDEQCTSGQACCPYTGTCYDPTQPDLCRAGASRPCSDDSQCRSYEICQGKGCSGVGECIDTALWMCTGVLNPVCGCDGRSYTNSGCAAAARVRVAHEGTCTSPDSGI